MAIDQQALGAATPPTLERIEPGKIERFCDVLTDHNPVFRVPEAATSSIRGGVVAPPTFINTFRADKTQLLLGQLGVSMAQILHGDEDIVIHEDLRPGQEVWSQVQLVEVSKKETRAFGEMDFFVVEIRVWSADADERALVTARQSFFVRSES